MKNFFFSAAVATLFFAAACNKDRDVVVLPGAAAEESDRITFISDHISAETSVKSVAAVSSLGKFNVAATTGSGAQEQYAWGTAKVVEFVKEKDKDSYSSDKFWPLEDPGFHFYASNAALTCTSGSSPTITASNTSDIVCAYLPSPLFKKPNSLVFNHIFARLGTVTVAAPGNGYSFTSVSITLTPKTGGIYSIKGGAGHNDGTGWSDMTTGTSLKIASKEGVNAGSDAYLVPGTYELTAEYGLKKDLYEENFTQKGSVLISGGSINNVKASLPTPEAGSGAIGLTFTVSVVDWDNRNVDASF